MPDNPRMHQDRHEGIAPDASPTPRVNEYTVPDAGQSTYVHPSTSIPNEYWQQAARTKTTANTFETSTVAAWVLVLLGLLIPLLALCAAIWATWMAREDSRFTAPAALGYGIVALAFLT